MSDLLARPSTGCANVRDTVAAIVTLAAQPFGGQVFRARAYPLKQTSFPAILVYGYEEMLTLVSENPSHYQGTDVCLMVVQILVAEADPEAAEQALELLIGAIRTMVLQSQALLGDHDAAHAGEIERILSVKTTRQIKAEADDIIGEAHIVFEMQWSESYWLRDDPVTAVDAVVTRFGQTVTRMNISLDPPPAVVSAPGPDPFLA
jgi:hypothetical protein